MTTRERIWNWLVRDWHWPAASLFAAVFLLTLAPVWYTVAGLPLMLVYVQLPLYMVHQGEEHLGDRFRLYFNRTIARGSEGLTPEATFWINSLGVWGVDLIALFLACYVDLSLGLIAVYLPLVNALGHIGPSIVKREYNPGLWTAIVLFLPIGGWAWSALGPGASLKMHAIGLGTAIGIHVAIIIHVVRRVKRLSREVAK